MLIIVTMSLTNCMNSLKQASNNGLYDLKFPEIIFKLSLFVDAVMENALRTGYFL